MRRAHRQNRVALVTGVLAMLVSAACTPAGQVVTGGDSGSATSNGSQSETAATAARSGDRDSFVVTYNDDTDDGKIVYTSNDRIVYRGASLLGWSYSLDRGQNWTYGGKVRPPEELGIGALWGDPAITTSGTNYNRVYISSLAAAISRIPTSGHHGPMNDAITGACVARSDDGGVHFAIQSCFSADGDFYDGAAMAAAAPGLFSGGDRRVFAAYLDVPHARVDVWASSDGLAQFARLPDPFPGMTMIGHPRLAYDRSTGALLVAAIRVVDRTSTSCCFVYMNRLIGNAWQRPVLVTHAVSGIDVRFNGVPLRVANLFAFDVGAASQTQLPDGSFRTNNDQIRMLYMTRDAETQRVYLRGAACRFDLSVCDDVPGWGTTPGNLYTPGQQFNPTVRAWPGLIGLPPVWKVTYQSTDDTSNAISIKQGNLTRLANGTPFFLPFNLVGPRAVCSDKRGYWGDYDQIAFVGFHPGSIAPEFLLAYSDSSLGCQQQVEFSSTHLHVSAKAFS